MPFPLKLLLANLLIVSCVLIGKKFPSLAGLIAAMPLTTLIVLVWLHFDSRGDDGTITSFVQGVFWGIFPTLIFFGVAWFLLRRGLPFFPVIALAFAAWLMGAVVHQLALK